MILIISDTGLKTRLTIKKGNKVLLRKSGTIKGLLKMVYDGTKREQVKKAILELEPLHKWMIGSDTQIKIKGL